jgi:hypothetical protein
MDHLPRIDDVMVVAPWCLEIRWAQPADRAPVPPAISRVDLSGWVATGGDVLAPLRDLKLFNQATVGNYGASVTWDHGEGDLSIDALHVKELVEQQKPFSTRAQRMAEQAQPLEQRVSRSDPRRVEHLERVQGGPKGAKARRHAFARFRS